MIYPKRPFVLINDSGFYFEEVHSNLKEVWNYPNYKELLEQIDELKKSQKVIFLYPTQRKERELLAVYMPILPTPLEKWRIVEKCLGGAKQYDEQEILKLAEGEKRYLWLSLFVFLRLGERYNWNPSYFWTHNPLQIWLSYDLSKINLQLTRKYLDSEEQFNYIYFLELISAELLGLETEESKAVLKLLKQPLWKEIEGIDIPERLREELLQQGGLCLTAEGKIFRSETVRSR